MTSVEHFKFWANPKFLHNLCHLAQHAWCVGHDVVATTGEVHGAAVERANFWAQTCYVVKTLGGTRHVSAGSKWQDIFIAAENQVASHACGEVDDHVGVGRTNTIDYFCVQFGIARAKPSAWVANVNVHNCSASFRGFNA